MNKNTHTVPRLKWKGKIVDEVGNVREVEFPTGYGKTKTRSKRTYSY